MNFKSQTPDDSQLNMTPMIDIVFQLILFFLFSLRFKALDYRIDTSLPKGRGLEPTYKPVDPLPSLRATIVRVTADDPSKTRTKVKIGGSEWILPDLATGGDAARDFTFRAIEARLLELHRGNSRPGEIACPDPTGSLVPHGDVIRVLDSFLGAGIAEVNFEGARSPLPRKR